MRFRKITLALFVCMALGAFAASIAQAAAGDGWTIGTTNNQTTAGTALATGTHERVSCKIHGTSTYVLTSTLLGAPIELTGAGIDCLERAGSSSAATIDNTTSKGHSEGVLTLTSVQVVKPAHCEVGGPTHEITTTALTDEVIMDPTAGSTVVFDRFFPETPANGIMHFSFEGPECALTESIATVKGSFCGESVHTNATGFAPNTTGTLTITQTLLFGPAQQTTGHSTAKPCAATVGSSTAQLSGAVDFELSGANAGKPSGAD
jgi:hypothetical protein